MRRLTPSSDKPKLLLTLACDGVRKEITGQETIVGLYPDTMDAANLPINFTPIIYLRVKFAKIGVHQLEFRATQEGGNALIQPVKFPISIQGDATATIVFGPVPLTIQSHGRVMFEVKLDDGNWLNALAMEFRKSPTFSTSSWPHLVQSPPAGPAP